METDFEVLIVPVPKNRKYTRVHWFVSVQEFDHLVEAYGPAEVTSHPGKGETGPFRSVHLDIGGIRVAIFGDARDSGATSVSVSCSTEAQEAESDV